MRRIIHISAFLFPLLLGAQEKSIQLSAHVVNEDLKPLSNVMVINKRIGTGFIAEIDGSFKTTALRKDTLIILCSGYTSLGLSMKDSTEKDNYNVTIQLFRKVYKPKQPSVGPKQKKEPIITATNKDSTKKLTKKDTDDYYNPDAVKLKTVTIYDIKTQQEIRKKIDSLIVKNTDDYRSYNVLASPITALYERFSKREQDKRKVEELENNDRKKEVLRDLLALYVSYDFIELSDEEFDDFLSKLYVPDDILRNATDYQLGEFIKKQYLAYKDYLRYR